MTHQDSWPPVSKELQPARTRLARWAWIPAVLVVPLIGWGAYALSQGDETSAEPAEADALGALVPGREPTVAAPDTPPPAAVPAPVEVAGQDDPGSGDDDSDVGDLEQGGARADLTDDDDSDDSDSADDTAPETTEAADDQGFWIQVASLRLKEKADRMAARLKTKGYDARSMAYGGPRAGWWHVVRLGPYVTRLEAEKAKLAFVRAERGSAAVVPRAHGPFYIQTASLRSEARAKTAVARLNRLGHNARVGTLKTRKRGVWHTIRVGPFDFETDAWGYLKLLEDDGVKGEITPRPKNPPPAEEPAMVEEPPAEEAPTIEDIPGDTPAGAEDLADEKEPADDSDSF